MLYIGIDPDTEASGVAFWNSFSKSLTFITLRFFELFNELKIKQLLNTGLLKVYIEAGWLHGTVSWHYAKNIRTAGRIGNNIGANHETGKKIVEMCKYIGIDYELVRPVKSKIDAKTFQKITGVKEKTNQEERDACMLVFGRK